MRPQISVIIPAYNEGERIAATIQAVRQGVGTSGISSSELLVVDDGSTDQTVEQASQWADRVIPLPHNVGKGAALEAGVRMAEGEILLFIDADLVETARHVNQLWEPIMANEADMTIAMLPRAERKAGFGLVRGLATQGIYHLSGYLPIAPLSGQRAIRRDVLAHIGGLSSGFGIEVGLTIDVARYGYRIVEVAIPFRHRETGRNWSGFVHRGKQFLQVTKTLLQKWREPIC